MIKDGQVDFDALKEELGQFEEVDGEKYELTWSGKQNAKRKAQEKVLGRTLNYIEEDSKNPDTTQNLYIEGDNLEVLKLLRQNYYGSVKMIYIDPPYNTGNDFVYNDNFKMNAKESDIAEGLVSEDGERLQKNLKSTNRYHANWLNMMYPRLKVARDLLREDGVIFVSIDDNEAHNLRKMCDEVFGVSSFVGIFSWRSRTAKADVPYGVSSDVEWIIAYAKSFFMAGRFGERKYYETDDFNDRWRLQDLTTNKTAAERPNSFFIMKNPMNGESFPPSEARTWSVTKETFQQYYDRGKIVFPGDYPFLNIKKPAFRVFEEEDKDKARDKYGIDVVRMSISTYLPENEVCRTEHGSKELRYIFNKQFFPYPKPIGLMSFFVKNICDSEALILDFFSGSATTAHAVMQLNAEDGGNRRFIMVQLPEKCDENSEAYKAGYKNICEIGKERIRRAGERIKEEIEGENGQLKLGEEPKKVPDIGFKVFRTSDTNIRWNLVESDHRQLDLDAIKDNPDVMDFTSNAKDVDVVYEIMLRQKDVPLSESMEILSHIGNRTYLYGSSYLICLETEVTEGMVDKLAAIDPLPIKFVFRDSAFKDDISLKDETFRRLEGLIAKNSGDVKKTYTVEFI